MFKDTGILGDLGIFLLKLHEMQKINNNLKDFIKKNVIRLLKIVEGKILDDYVDCIDSIAKQNNLNSLIFSFNNSKHQSFDSAIYTCLLKSKKNLHIIDQIELTVEWNRHDIAENLIFNEKIDWVSY